MVARRSGDGSGGSGGWGKQRQGGVRVILEVRGDGNSGVMEERG